MLRGVVYPLINWATLLFFLGVCVCVCLETPTKSLGNPPFFCWGGGVVWKPLQKVGNPPLFSSSPPPPPLHFFGFVGKPLQKLAPAASPFKPPKQRGPQRHPQRQAGASRSWRIGRPCRSESAALAIALVNFAEGC